MIHSQSIRGAAIRAARHAARIVAHVARPAGLVCAGLVPVFAQAVPIAERGTWTSTLEARDIDGDGTIEAYYDTVLDLTWLTDANAGAGSGFDDGFNNSDGRMSWNSANAWAAALVGDGVAGWRLPTLLGGTTTVSEISRMYYETLGNFGPGNPLTMTPPGTWGFENTGPFDNLFSLAYWTNVLADPDPVFPEATSWFGDPISAYHSDEPIGSNFYAWAVRDGDVTAIPEPQTYSLMLIGLGALAWARARAGKR